MYKHLHSKKVRKEVVKMYDVTLNVNDYKGDVYKSIVLLKSECTGFRIMPHVSDSVSGGNSIEIVLELYGVKEFRYQKDVKDV